MFRDFYETKDNNTTRFLSSRIEHSFYSLFFCGNSDKTAYVTVVLTWPSRKSVELYVKFKQN